MGRPACNKPGHEQRRKDGRCLRCVQNAQMRHYRANSLEYKARAKAWAASNEVRRRTILRRYNHKGVVPTRPCPELCEICEKRKARCLEHDHATGKFRGWVCTSCNTALAAFGDTLDGVLRAVGYLIRGK